MIQDGNYNDFTVGQKARFAMEFFDPDGLRPSRATSATARHLGASRYDVCAQVVFVTLGVWVVHAGDFVAFQERTPPPHARAGAWVEGVIYLGIDPYFYLEYLHRLERIPPLTFEFLIRGIQRETTPWIQTIDSSSRRRVYERDSSREAFVPVAKTDAWADDDGNAEYVLECERIGGPTAR